MWLVLLSPVVSPALDLDTCPHSRVKWPRFFPRCPPQISTHARQRVGERRRQGLVVIDMGTGVGRNERAAVGRAIVRDLLLISMVILSACVSATEQPAPRRLSL